VARIALKIDVDTLRGTREGVPALVSMLQQAEAQATFLFSLGPDHTGWAMRRVFRPGFLKKVSRTSVVEHYGIKTLLYGTLLPGPDIGRRAAAYMQAVRDAGFEVGIHTWDHVYWQDNVRGRDRAWTERQMQRAFDRFTEVFGVPPATHGAAGWQTNGHALELIDRWGMRYASDGRGTAPYRPSVDGRTLDHVQMPTTLPTLDELIGVDGIETDTVAAALLSRTAGAVTDHIFTLHAELEGQKLAPVFRALLAGWRSQGHTLVSMADYYAALDLDTLPVLPFTWGEIPGRSGELMIQP
jgi:peptidoglycan/xylan/chitin deacetylase (PgdA/CDA1 family)